MERSIMYCNSMVLELLKIRDRPLIYDVVSGHHLLETLNSSSQSNPI